ncbi:MAG: isoaspartyl peptidase/L-asparaginase [Crocinitomicaceae bacterium]|nr:isoaspartyl peptidase/L-asparaginase [Crocinitomicaceae bacterium]
MSNYALAIHGGAGTILKSLMTPEKEQQYRLSLQEAIQAGEAILKSNGSALDAVEAAVRCLENNPLFNAGKGAVFTHDAKHELDASIMCGDTLEAGAVAGVQRIKNPISLARDVMEKSEHVLMCGEGAEQFAKSVNAVFETDEYFFVQARFDQLQEALKTDGIFLDHSGESKTEDNKKKFGTVGAVALDRFGNIAAATSTGGMTNKKFGRAGDSPIIGAGTYANNKTCAVSCTGHGEFFIRSVVAYDISCLMEYKGYSLKQACDEVVINKLVKIGGEGGLVAIDAKGNIELSFNSEGMYRAFVKEGENIYTGIYTE